MFNNKIKKYEVKNKFNHGNINFSLRRFWM